MEHPATRELFAYWQQLRGRRPAPERGEIQPGAIRHILSEAFILALDETQGFPFRLAGTRLCALIGRELKGESFLRLWSDDSHRTIRDLLDVLRNEWVGTVASATGLSGSGDIVEVELLLLPLCATRPNLARSIGVLAPLKIPRLIGVDPLGALTLGARRHVGPAAEKRLLPRFLSPRRQRSFVVYEGGRS